MICATPRIVSFDKYFKQHQGDNLALIHLPTSNKRIIFKAPVKALVFGPKLAAVLMW